MDELTSELRSAGFTLIETHISRVFLRGDDVYKLKRPVNLGFLDFSSLRLREQACHAELTLNRRLAADVYLGVVALVRGPTGLSFRKADEVEASEVLEWAVHMRRLPDDTRADLLLERGAFEREDCERVARMLAGFHAQARADAATAAFGAAAVIAGNVEENFTQTADTIDAYLAAGAQASLRAYQREFLREHGELFAARARDGHVRDGHGDLRLEHLYRSADGSYIAIDCIEFNDRFRYADVCADLAFLAMDLSHHQRADLAELLIAAYARERGDYGLYALLDFYQSYRAVVRAKVASILAQDTEVSAGARERARAEARRYYVLALSASARPATPARVIVTFGGIASGKSTLAEALADRLAIPVLSSDYTRKQLLGAAPTEPKHDPAFAGAYTREQSARVYALLLERAAQVLRSGRSVILDATFRAQGERRAVCELASKLGLEALFLECRCPREVALERLRERATKASVSDGRAEIFDAVAASFEPVAALTPARHLALDTSRPHAENVGQSLSFIGFEAVHRLR